MKTPTLALDLGTKVGWACGHTWPAVEHAVVSLAPTRFESQGMRYVKFRQLLNRLWAAYRFEEIVFEEVNRHNGVLAAHIYGGLLATLQTWATDNLVEYGGKSVQAIKKHATGRGNASKDEVISAVKSWGFIAVKDDNEADAIALLKLKLEELIV